MWLDIQIFGFRALWSPYFLSYIIFLGLAYYLITGVFYKKLGGDEKPSIKQQLYFYAGLVLLYAMKGSPVDLLSHIMLTAHMLQLAVFYLVFPIFILKGIPVWIWKKVIERPIIKPLFNLFSKPLIAILLFNLLFSVYHMPVIFDFSKSSQLAHSSINLIVLIAAFLMWWNIVSPFKKGDEMAPILKIGYIFANAALITPACALIIFSTTPLFGSYSANGAWMQAMSLCVPTDVLKGLAVDISGAEMFSPLSTMDDQQLGGIIMQTLSTIFYGTMIGRVFFAWFNKGSQEIDPLPVSETTF